MTADVKKRKKGITLNMGEPKFNNFMINYHKWFWIGCLSLFSVIFLFSGMIIPGTLLSLITVWTLPQIKMRTMVNKPVFRKLITVHLFLLLFLSFFYLT